MNYFDASSIDQSIAAARRLSHHRLGAIPDLPDDGSRTAAALHEALAAWRGALGAADAGTETLFSSLADFLNRMRDEDALLAARLREAPAALDTRGGRAP